MSDSNPLPFDEHDTLPPSMDPAAGDGTVEPPTKFFGILKRLGPGLIIAGSIVGSGELIATTKTGAQAGIVLFWLIIIGCVIKVFVQIELGRYTIGHGETTLSALDQVPGPRFHVNWIIWFWLAMMLLGIGQLGGIVGGVGQATALAIPFTGDYTDATQYPSAKEIEKYLKRDDAILSEWPLLRSPFSLLGADGEIKPVNSRSPAERWKVRARQKTDRQMKHIKRFNVSLFDKIEKRVSATESILARTTFAAGETREGLYAESREKLADLLKQANALLLQKAAGGEIDDKALVKLSKVEKGQRTRILRGHAILSRRIHKLDRSGSRMIRAVVAVEELKRRQAVLKSLPAETAAKLDRDIAEVRVDEQEKVLAAILEPQTWDDKIWAALFTLMTAGLLYRGRYQMIQLIATVLVVAFTFVTIGNVVALQMTEEWHIPLSEFLQGLSFSLPEATDGVTPLATALATFGIIGVGAAELITYPYWCLEKGYAKFTGKCSDDENWAQRARGWMKVMHYDAFASMLVYTLATIAFFMMGVAVLHNEGRDPDGMRMVSTLATAYVPVFGAYAKWLFLGGAVAVLYSTFLVATAGNARMYTDALKIYRLMDHNNQKAHDRALSAFSVLLPFLCLAVFCSGINPVRTILISGAMQALLLPMVGFGALYFRFTRTDSRIKPGPMWDTLLILSFIGLFIAGSYGAYKQIVKFF